VFLVNSRFPLVSAAHTRSQQQVPVTGQAPLLPKLRGHFAEFLNHNSLDRLGILYLITCVGFGYGRLKPRADAFLGSIGSPDSPIRGSHQISGTRTTDLPVAHPTSLDQDNHRPARLPSCVTPVNTLTSRDQVPRSPKHPRPKGPSVMVRVVSIPRSVWAVLRRYGNINPLSIDYACRPRLRSRLTQGRLA
jgi:hypothetical protein